MPTGGVTCFSLGLSHDHMRYQFSSVQSLSHVWLFATPWIAAHQASLSITNSRGLPKLMSESVMPSSHLILCHPLLLPPNPSQHQSLFQWVNSLHEVAKVLEFFLSLLFNMLSRLIITFLPRSKHLLISWLQSPSAVILEPPKIKSDTVSTVSPSICH